MHHMEYLLPYIKCGVWAQKITIAMIWVDLYLVVQYTIAVHNNN